MAVDQQIVEFLSSHESPVLFAGAGVSARAGVPTWGEYLTRLAEVSRQHDPITRHIIMERIHDGDFTDAATYYFLCKKIPETEKYQALSEPFRKYDHKILVPLTDLPFTAFVTTNYDRALHDAFAISRKVSAVDIHLGDPTLNSAPFTTDVYIARIHGRCEAPETMILDNNHYKQLLNDRVYIDFLTHIFTRKQILFLGFSFLDPAIESILNTVYAHVGKVHKGRHLALLPEGPHSDLVNKLEKHSISTSFYDPSNKHEALWSAISVASDRLSSERVEISQVDSKAYPLAAARNYLASCYSRSRLGARINPLRNAVVEGIIGHYLIEQGSAGASPEKLNEEVENHLSLNKSDAEQIVGEAIGSLHKDGLCIASDSDPILFVWNGQCDDSYEIAIKTLIDGTINRYIVREAGLDSEGLRRCLKCFFEKLVLVRGWDLGASFAANRPPENVDIPPIMRTVELFQQLNICEHINGLSRAADNLIRNPNSQEAQVLAELGRVSFALELVIQAPHDTLFHRLTLPQRIFLDANVLMPAVTVGHPYHEVYKGTIENLLTAGSRSLVNIQIVAYDGFLNEVVSHRRIAIEEIRHIKDDLLDSLKRKALLDSTANMNVFIGAYANLLANEKDLKFDAYLRKYAPYENEKQLKKWLGQKGIKILGDREMLRSDSEFPNILHTLEVGYAEFEAWKNKGALLIRHDAIQLAALHEDARLGIKSIFVSADKRLRDVVSGGVFSDLANYMVSNVGLTQLIDLLVGNPVESKGLSRMLWAGKLSEQTEQIRNYLIDVALNEYDDAIAMEMNKVVDSISEDIVIDANKQDVHFPPRSIMEEQTLNRIIDTYEDRFFSTMRELVEKRRGNTPQ